MKECLSKRGLDVRQGKRMVQESSDRRGFVRGECMGRSPGDKLLTLARCHSYMKHMKRGGTLWPSLQLIDIKGICSVYFSPS